MADSTFVRGPTTAHRERQDTDPLESLAEGSDVIVVSNRQPYRHEWRDGEIAVERPTGGLSEGLDSAMRKIHGSWVAWGDGDADADVVDDHDTLRVPPDAAEDEQYDLKRVWLTDEQVENYYYGFSNRVLWPVCHNALLNVSSENSYWDVYEEVNEVFADAVAERANPGDVVWMQDYHFALMPRMARERLHDDVSLAHFWHIPWPAWDTFRACPHAEEILRGLLGNDLFGVHVPRYQQNFLGCVDAALPEARIDWDQGKVFYDDGVTAVESFPLGVDTERIQRLAGADDARERYDEFRERHAIPDGVGVALGVDRLDYTKGIPNRLDALEELFERRPDLRGELTYVQIGTESRSQIDAYEDLQDQVAADVERLNERFGTDDWRPVVYTTDRVPNETLHALYRYVDVGIVTPLRDGMNLVAQEFVAAQSEEDPGVLVLSDQAGVHDVFDGDTVTVSPHDTEQFAEQLQAALSMPLDERRERMAALVAEASKHDVSVWMDDVLERLVQLRTETREGHHE